jgi:hypothetical protein
MTWHEKGQTVSTSSAKRVALAGRDAHGNWRSRGGMQFGLADGPSSGAGNKLFDKATRRARELALTCLGGCALSFARLDVHDEMLTCYRHLTPHYWIAIDLANRLVMCCSIPLPIYCRSCLPMRDQQGSDTHCSSFLH